jgi:phytoene synthase
VFAVTARLLEVAEPYYASAVAGLAALPWRSAWAIAAARGVYRQIGVEVMKRGPHAWDERVSTSTATKARLALIGGVMAIASRGKTSAERPALWSKI